MLASAGGSAWEAAVQALRADPARQGLVRDAYYDDPLDQAAVRYRGSEEWQAIRKLLPGRPSRVLDIGAGRGIASFAFAQDGHLVCALEPDPSPVVGAAAIRDLASTTGSTIEVREGHSESLPYPDESFDVVFARAVLHHAADLNALCCEAYRVLRHGGRFIAVREHVISRPEDLAAFLAAHPLHRHFGGEHAYVLGSYAEAFTQAGFALQRVLTPLASPINYAPHTLAGLKREVAQAAASGLPALAATCYAVLCIPGVWRLVRPALRWLDSRPGRLYSFVAYKP